MFRELQDQDAQLPDETEQDGEVRCQGAPISRTGTTLPEEVDYEGSHCRIRGTESFCDAD